MWGDRAVDTEGFCLIFRRGNREWWVIHPVYRLRVCVLLRLDLRYVTSHHRISRILTWMKLARDHHHLEFPYSAREVC